MMKFIGMGKDLKGYSAADMIVGKAAAMLFCKSRDMRRSRQSHVGSGIGISGGTSYPPQL